MLLEVNGIVKKYGKKVILNDLSFSSDGGKIVAFVGKNGCGKSTFFKCLLGLACVQSGSIKLDKGAKCCGVIEEPAFFPFMTGLENLECLIGDKIKNHLSRVAEELEIVGYLNKKVVNYSQGMKQRLGIAYIILSDEQVMIFDEPTNALDPIGIECFRKSIEEEKKKGKLILISSHDLYFIDEIADEIFFFKEGSLIKRKLKENNSGNFLTEYEFTLRFTKRAYKNLKSKYDLQIREGKLYAALDNKTLQLLIRDLIDFEILELTRVERGNIVTEFIELVEK